MSETSDEDYGSGQSSVEDNSYGQRGHSEEIAEWRSSVQVENGSPSTSPTYIDENGSKHSELFGKHTLKIEKYSEINTPSVRSDVFVAGGYKWYILISPQGCDIVRNHLSLFLCLANHEELRPGWSHFAQSTIALVNKDPKKSIYSDIIHLFRKREHLCGWKDFIELPKLQEGYIDDLGSLIIKAQVQVIRERVDRPLRCLSSQYRRELVRVYLPYVENICWEFMEEERDIFSMLIQNKEKWESFRSFWLRLNQNTRRKMCREKMDVVLNLAAKIFFVLEQGTSSTLVMDSLYSGWKSIEGQTKKKRSRERLMDDVEFPAPIVSVDQDMFVLVNDLLLLIERSTVMAPFPIKEEKGSQNLSKEGNVGEKYSKEEAIGREESRLTEVGRRTMEMLVLAHIYSNKVDVAYQEHIALIRQEQLIHEEEEELLAESKRKAKRGTTEKERKSSKKKQAKQKKKKKERRKEERLRSEREERDIEKEESVREKTDQSSAEKPDTLGESSPEIHHPCPLGDSTSRGRGSSISIISSGVAVNDNTSVCSNFSNWQTKSWRRKGKRKVCGANSLATDDTEGQPSRHASNPKSQTHSSEVIIKTQNPREHNNPVTKEKSPAVVFSPPKASPRNLTSVAQTEPEKRGVFNEDTLPYSEQAISAPSPLSDPSPDIQLGSRAAVQNTTSPKPPSMSRPFPAPTFLPKQAAPPSVSAAPTSTTSFVSSPTHCPTYIPQSYKHAILGPLSSDHSSSQSTGTSALLSVSNQPVFPHLDIINDLLEEDDVQIRRPAQSLMTDEFPHLDIINDLLEEEHGLVDTSAYLRLPQWLNDVYSFLADLRISGMSRSYSNDGVYQSYSEYMSPSSSSSSSNPNLSARMNTYRAFRPSNGN